MPLPGVRAEREIEPRALLRVPACLQLAYSPARRLLYSLIVERRTTEVEGAELHAELIGGRNWGRSPKPWHDHRITGLEACSSSARTVRGGGTSASGDRRIASVSKRRSTVGGALCTPGSSGKSGGKSMLLPRSLAVPARFVPRKSTPLSDGAGGYAEFGGAGEPTAARCSWIALVSKAPGSALVGWYWWTTSSAPNLIVG